MQQCRCDISGKIDRAFSVNGIASQFGGGTTSPSVTYLGANFNLVHTEKRIVHIPIDAPEAMSKSEIEYGSDSWKSPLTFQGRME